MPEIEVLQNESSPMLFLIIWALPSPARAPPPALPSLALRPPAEEESESEAESEAEVEAEAEAATPPLQWRRRL